MKTDASQTSVISTHICRYCNEPIFGKRSDAKFCSARCRQQNYLDKKEDPRIKSMAKLFYDLTSKEPGEHDEHKFGLINTNLSDVIDPSKYHKFDGYVYYLRVLGTAKTVIEQLFKYEKEQGEIQIELEELLATISKKVTELKKTNNQKMNFLIAWFTEIANLIRQILSEVKLKSHSGSKFTISETKQQLLISYHAHIVAKMEVK